MLGQHILEAPSIGASREEKVGEAKMKSFIKLIFTGLLGGTILAGFLILVYIFTGNEAYYLLFNVDYIPVLKDLQPVSIVEISFHYIFCIVSVILLFYILKMMGWERRQLFYMVIYTGGSAVLFSLTAFSEAAPALTDFAGWSYWTFGHFIYSVVVGLMIKYWV